MTFSDGGISDSEMVDLLSLDSGVMNGEGINQYATSVRLSSLVWLRLRGAMKGLVVEKDGGCVVWYHR